MMRYSCVMVLNIETHDMEKQEADVDLDLIGKKKQLSMLTMNKRKPEAELCTNIIKITEALQAAMEKD